MRMDEVDPSEIQLYRDHLVGLSTADRQLRFGAPMNDEAINRYVDGMLARGEPVLALWLENQVVACVHVAIANGDAELGISVDHQYRGQGYGRLLFVYAVMWARQHGAKRIITQCVAQNRWMIELSKREGMHLERDGSEVFADKVLKSAA